MLKVFQLNIEGDNHYHRIFPFLEQHQPDVLCFQELFAVDLKEFEVAYPHTFFAPVTTFEKPSVNRINAKGLFGCAILSKFPFTSTFKKYYVGSEESITPYRDELHDPNQFHRVLLSATMEYEERNYRVSTTHFTWSTAGEVTDEQRRDLNALMNILDEIAPTILTGDFNAPRGSEIFDTIAKRYTDNVPAHLTTSIDQHLHRVPGIQLMVDGFFTSQEFQVVHIEMIDGLSDHQGLLATVRSSLEQ
jgi:endonuclease/exonuclease/phosphatase family metal-dependent hydrolase